MAKMGMQFGLESGQYCKRSNRWIFSVSKTIGDESAVAINALPPSKAARPQLAFTEINIKHLIEDVYIPGKPDWKPITITVFDLEKNENPIWKWINNFYDPQRGRLFAPNQNRPITNGVADDIGFFRECTLTMVDGCGSPIEQWIFEDAWPQQIDFSSLDYEQQDVMMIDITLRYARAYINF